jgi:hypothetical protein
VIMLYFVEVEALRWADPHSSGSRN